MKSTIACLLTIFLVISRCPAFAQSASRPQARTELNSFYVVAMKAFASKDANVVSPSDAILKYMKPFQAKYRMASFDLMTVEVDTALSDDKLHQNNVATLILRMFYAKPKKGSVKPAKLVMTVKDFWQQNEARDYAWELKSRSEIKDKFK